MNCMVNGSVQEDCLCACSEGIAVFIVDCGPRWRHMVGFVPHEVGWAPEMFFIAFVEGINLVSLPGIEPQFLSSPPLSLVTALPTPPCLPSCSNIMYLFILIK